MSHVQAMRAATDELAEAMDRLSRSEAGPTLSAWRRFTAAAHADGALSRRQKELTAVAISIVKGCERCISYHVKAALAQGASPAEIQEAALVAVIMDGGPALAHMGLVLDAIEAHRGGST
ncbi:MAG: carboxymuconolactone decarboxylase family protein [Candidatus Bipolaricaulota bacterium]